MPIATNAMDKIDFLVWSIGEDEPEYDENTESEHEEWSNSLYDDFVVYVMFSPFTWTAKIGLAKNKKCLHSRLEEKQRHCGHSVISGVLCCPSYSLKEVKVLEKEVLKYADSHPFSQKLGKESFRVEDPSWLDDLLSAFGFISFPDFEKIRNYEVY